MPLPRFVDYSLRFIAPISLGLALYFHYQSVQERVPTFYVSPTRARIVDTSIPAPPQLQVLYKGKDLNANVSAAVVYVWNDGKLPIRADDILEPMRIVLDPSCEIIDARILKVSRAVTKFAKGEVSDTAKNVLPISFGILERNDGAALQIIYSGTADTTVSVAGTVVGAAAPRALAPDERNFEADAWKRKLRLQEALGFLLTTMGAFIAGWWTEPWMPIAELLGLPIKPKPALPPSPARIFTLFLCVALSAAGVIIETRAIHHLSPSVPESIWLKQ